MLSNAGTLVLGNKKYIVHSYKKETELEKVVEEKAIDIFGDFSFYFQKRQLKSLDTGVKAIPDGFLLDTSDPDNPIFYIVEVELKRHGLKHIATQILKFAISYKESKPELNKLIKKILRSHKVFQRKIEKRLQESNKYSYLDQLIDAAMNEDMPTVIIPIDGLERDLEEVQEYISVPILYIPITTYTDTKSGEKVYQFTPLSQEEESAAGTGVGTRYRFMMRNIELIEVLRSEFDEKNNISKQTQGYTFVRDKTGKPKATVFWWYRSRIERHIKEEETWAATRRPVDPRSYEVGMDIYIGETYWDKDTGQRIKNPKYRIRGKLKEIYRLDGEKRTKIFPIASD